jgi:hypothetical protein
MCELSVQGWSPSPKKGTGKCGDMCNLRHKNENSGGKKTTSEKVVAINVGWGGLGWVSWSGPYWGHWGFARRLWGECLTGQRERENECCITKEG